MDDRYWSSALNEVKFGDEVMNLQTSNAILDSGSSYIVMPEVDFNSLRELIESSGADGNRSCGIDRYNNNYLYCSCLSESYDDFPDL